MAEYYFIVWIYHVLFTLSSVDEYLAHFYFLAIINNAVMSICTQIFVWTYSFNTLGCVCVCVYIYIYIYMLDHIVTCFTI